MQSFRTHHPKGETKSQPGNEFGTHLFVFSSSSWLAHIIPFGRATRQIYWPLFFSWFFGNSWWFQFDESSVDLTWFDRNYLWSHHFSLRIDLKLYFQKVKRWQCILICIQSQHFGQYAIKETSMAHSNRHRVYLRLLAAGKIISVANALTRTSNMDLFVIATYPISNLAYVFIYLLICSIC